MTYIPDPIELGESRAECHADLHYTAEEFQCAGCKDWFKWDQAVQASPDPYAPAVCWKCSGFAETQGVNDG